MPKLTELQRKKLAQALKMINQEKAELIMHILNIEEKMDDFIVDAKPLVSIASDINAIKDSVRPVAGEDFPNEKQIYAFIKKLVDQIPPPKDADEQKMIASVLNTLSKQFKQPKDGADAIVDYDFIISEVIDNVVLPQDGKDGSPDTPEQIADKLELLKGDNRLDISAIKGIDKLEEKIGSSSKSGGSGFGVRFSWTPMVDDFSGDTDGSTKVFYLSKSPRSTTTMKIWGSDFPHILRANTDFTVANKKLTLTAEVDAPSSGATLIAEYYV